MDSQMDMVRDISRQSNQYFFFILIMNEVYRHYVRVTEKQNEYSKKTLEWRIIVFTRGNNDF